MPAREVLERDPRPNVDPWAVRRTSDHARFLG